jgi:hypothetical protein
MSYFRESRRLAAKPCPPVGVLHTLMVATNIRLVELFGMVDDERKAGSAASLLKHDSAKAGMPDQHEIRPALRA